MRYLVALLFFVLAVGTLRVVGCGETPGGDGGTGGTGGVAGDGGNGGTGGVAGDGGTGGTGGVAGDGGNGGTGGVAGDGGTGGDGGVGGDPIADLVDKIRTKVVPAFVYSYEQTKFVPPKGKTLLIVGQTWEDINEYTADFPDEPAPGGWAAYWGIPSTDGLWKTAGNGRSQNHQELVYRFPHTVLQSGLWMVGMWGVAKDTADGVYDEVIREFSTWAKTINCPIYLRIGYEFDGAHNQLEPEEYKEAYKRFVDITREEGVNNVAFVWHSYAAPRYKGYALGSWYPGDDYVDWVAVSLFGHLYGRRVSDFSCTGSGASVHSGMRPSK